MSRGWIRILTPRKDFDPKVGKRVAEEISLWGRGIEGEGPPWRQSGIPKKESRSRNSIIPVVIVLIIYNTGSGRSASFLNHSLQITLSLTFWKVLKNTRNLNSSYCYKISPQEISFYFCHTSAAKRLEREKSSCGCGAVTILCERQFINRKEIRYGSIVVLNQNILWNQAAVKNFNNTYCMSPAPLTFCVSLLLTFF